MFFMIYSFIQDDRINKMSNEVQSLLFEKKLLEDALKFVAILSADSRLWSDCPAAFDILYSTILRIQGLECKLTPESYERVKNSLTQEIEKGTLDVKDFLGRLKIQERQVH